MNDQLYDSVLNSTKKLIGIDPSDKSFDMDILFHLNAALFTLIQLGVITKPYTIKSEYDTYFDVFGNLSEDIVSQAALYLAMKTKLGFDPPSISIVNEVLKTQIAEAEWRLNVSVDPPDVTNNGEEEIQNE